MKQKPLLLVTAPDMYTMAACATRFYPGHALSMDGKLQRMDGHVLPHVRVVKQRGRLRLERLPTQWTK